MSLISIRKGIQMWVVEETFVAISPGETLRGQKENKKAALGQI